MKRNNFVIKKPVNMIHVYLTMVFILLSNVVFLFASQEDGILAATDNGTKTVIDRIIVWVDTTVLPIVLVSLVICLILFCRNDKVLPTIKTGFKVLAIGAILINALWLLLRTILWVADVISSGSSTSTEDAFTSITNAIQTFIV